MRLAQVRYERDDLAGAVALLEQGRRCAQLIASGWTQLMASHLYAKLAACAGCCSV